MIPQKHHWWTASTLFGKKILNDGANLPTPYIRLFGKYGSYNGRHYFEPQFRSAEQGEDTMTEESSMDTMTEESSMDTSGSEKGHIEDMIEQEQSPCKNEQTQSEHTQTRGMAHETTARMETKLMKMIQVTHMNNGVRGNNK